MTVMRWCVQDEVNHEESEQNVVNEERSWFRKKADAYQKQWLLICNKDDADGQARVTTDEEGFYM